MAAQAQTRVLFLCTGNSCRSQMAEGFSRHLKSGEIEAHSAGVNPKGVDPRAVKAMAEVGIDISAQKSRSIDEVKHLEFDYVIGMDHGNIGDMRAIRPTDARARLQLMLEYSSKYSQAEVPDPYFGDDGFELVFDMIDDASLGLLDHIRREHGI